MLTNFRGVELWVGPVGLVPRSGTELLGRTALDLLAPLSHPIVIDMCCGSGNVGLGIASGRADVRLYGSDITAETVAHARLNAERLALTPRVTYDQGALFTAPAKSAPVASLPLGSSHPPSPSTAPPVCPLSQSAPGGRGRQSRRSPSLARLVRG